MTNKELIELLQKFPEDLNIEVDINGYRQYNIDCVYGTTIKTGVPKMMISCKLPAVQELVTI